MTRIWHFALICHLGRVVRLDTCGRKEYCNFREKWHVARDIIPSAAKMMPISNSLDNPLNEISNLLDMLPPELIFRILDCMEPHEYSGFSYTCREAIRLVNRKLDNVRDQEEFWFELDLNSSQALYAQILNWKSRTAEYVAKKRTRRQLKSEKRRRWEMEDYVCVYYGPSIDDDDADL